MRLAETMRLDADTIEEIERLQEESRPKEDLSAYAGEYVALRKGRVVGHDIDFLTLRRYPKVRVDDLIVHVPGPGETYLA